MARRRDVKSTVYAAVFSPLAARVEQVPVLRANGEPADAAGIKVTLTSGDTLHALANYEAAGVPVRLGTCTTSDRFGTDFSSK
jgi:hypothetical protein